MAQSLSLLDLPSEIRVMVLKLLLSRPYTLRMNRYQDVYFGGCDTSRTRASDFKKYELAPQLLRACRRLLTEGLPILYSNKLNVDFMYHTARARYFCEPLTHLAEPYTLNLTQNQIPLMTSLEVTCGSYDRATIPPDPDEISPLFVALELATIFHHQLRWVQCIIPKSDVLNNTMDYLARREKPAPFEYTVFHHKGDKGRLKVTPSDEYERFENFLFKYGVLRVVRAAELACPMLTRRVYRTISEDEHPFTGVGQAVVLCRDPQVLTPVDSDHEMHSDDKIFYYAELKVDTTAYTVKEISGLRAGFVYPD